MGGKDISKRGGLSTSSTTGQGPRLSMTPEIEKMIRGDSSDSLVCRNMTFLQRSLASHVVSDFLLYKGHYTTHPHHIPRGLAPLCVINTLAAHPRHRVFRRVAV